MHSYLQGGKGQGKFPQVPRAPRNFLLGKVIFWGEIFPRKGKIFGFFGQSAEKLSTGGGEVVVVLKKFFWKKF
jgi:hypothetical protein